MSVVENSLKNQEEQIQHIQAGLEVQKIDKSYSIRVPARTLESILDEFTNIPQIDFFSLDVEGYELQVLQGLNLDRYKPKYILVEGRFFDEINSFLTTYYDLAAKLSYHDYLYQLREIHK